MTESELRDTLAVALDREAAGIDGDANLVMLGLTSLDLMRLVGRWRRAGADVSFEALVAEPTLNAWLAHLGASDVG